MAGKLRPLWTPGGSRSAGGLRGLAPSLVTGPLPSSVAFFDDFFTNNVAKTRWGVGLVATPDTITHEGPLGHPAWIGGEPIGTTGVIENAVSATNAFGGCGLCFLKTGATSGDTITLDLGANQAAGTGAMLTGTVALPRKSLGMWRFGVLNAAHLAGTNWGLGWVLGSSANVGTDWITDPDTVFAAANSVIITRHIASYSGDAAGDVMLRVYSASGADTSSTILFTSAEMIVNTAYKVEVVFDGAAQSIAAYANGVQKAALSGLSNFFATTNSLRPASIAQSTSAATKFFTLDCYYQEIEQPSPR